MDQFNEILLLFVLEKDRVPNIGIQYLLCILTSVWVLHTPNAGQNVLFLIFSMKHVKKEKRRKNYSKYEPLGKVDHNVGIKYRLIVIHKFNFCTFLKNNKICLQHQL